MNDPKSIRPHSFLRLGAWLLLFHLFSALMAYAGSYYVRTDGNDSCNGLYNMVGSSGNCAWKTLQKAANSVAAGDTVLVADGTYAGFYIETSGTAEKPITFKAIGKGANITSRNTRTADGINIESWGSWKTNYITVDGLNVSSQTRMGIRAIAGTGIVIRNCVVHDNGGTGIFSGNTPHIQVLDNVAYRNGDTQYEHNIYISNAESDYPVIRGNTVYSSGAGNGIQLNGDWAMGGDGFIDNALIENNLIYDNFYKGLSLISVRYGTIQNNVLYNNGGAGGIHIVEESGENFSIDNNVINNTLHETRTVCIRINASNVGNSVFNNVCVNGGNRIVFEGSGNYKSNNFEAATAGSLFVNATARDYHLADGSAAIGIGAASYRGISAPATDKDGKARTPAYDAGAYEYVTASIELSAPTNLRLAN